MASCVPEILCYTLGVLGGSVTAVGQRIWRLKNVYYKKGNFTQEE